MSLAATGKCKVSGLTVHITGVGVCKVTASQAGDSNYAATDISHSFTISLPSCGVPIR